MKQWPVVGVLIGGASSRMGGRPKGLIELKGGETILSRTMRISREAGLEAVLVGDLAIYDAINIPRIADAADITGPLAGLHALLEHAQDRSVIALACDMPFVTPTLLRRLAIDSPRAIVLAPRSADGQKWEPLCARYAASVRPILAQAIERGDQSFQQLFKRLQVTELALSDEERNATIDWDTPSDMTH